jgi:hypothetical protein
MKFLLTACLLLGAAVALAANGPLLDVDKFVAQQRDVREDFRYSKKFAHVTEADKQRLYRAQDELFALLENRSSVDELTTDQRIALFNAQETVSAVLLEAELDREVCRREKTVGSHRATLVCTTVRERRAMKETARNMLLAPRVCDTNCGG